MKDDTKKIIDAYLKLNFGDKTISCPYFNNKKTANRASLRALIGKGSPKEIIEEATIIAIKQKIDLAKLDETNLKKFLIDNNLGIDCSGLIYHILKTEYPNLKLFYKNSKNILRKILIKLRPAENSNVLVFDHEKNSTEIELKDINENNFIVSLNGGNNKNYNHIILIEKITKINDELKTIDYLHSFRWPDDGIYNHGVRRGKIEIIDKNKSILEQNWTEQDKTGDKNWTLRYLKTAEIVKIKKLKDKR